MTTTEGQESPHHLRHTRDAVQRRVQGRGRDALHLHAQAAQAAGLQAGGVGGRFVAAERLEGAEARAAPAALERRRVVGVAGQPRWEGGG